MANLVTVTKEGRLFLKIGGVLFAVIFIIYLFVQGGTIIKNVFFPKPPPPPLQAFGKLPRISFPSQGSPGIQFRINTLNGQLPILKDRINVYKLKKTEPDLLALEKARNILDNEDFTENQLKISDTLYQWAQQKTGVIIQYDIVSKNFTISSDFLTNNTLTSSSLMPEEEDIKRDVRSFLVSLGYDLDGIDTSKIKVEYLENQSGNLVPATNLRSAKYARVTLSQNNLDDVPIIYGTNEDSLLTFVVSYPTASLQILQGTYFNHTINSEEKSDYPIKSPMQAFEDLKSGNAYMINPQALPEVDITEVKLGYYLNKESHDFLLPVIIFNGINFVGYVEAIPVSSLSE